MMKIKKAMIAGLIAATLCSAGGIYGQEAKNSGDDAKTAEIRATNTAEPSEEFFLQDKNAWWVNLNPFSGRSNKENNYERLCWEEIALYRNDDQKCYSKFKELLPRSLQNYKKDLDLDSLVSSAFMIRADGKTSFEGYFSEDYSNAWIWDERIKGNNYIPEIPNKGAIIRIPASSLPYLTENAIRDSFNVFVELKALEMTVDQAFYPIRDARMHENENAPRADYGQDRIEQLLRANGLFPPLPYQEEMVLIKSQLCDAEYLQSLFREKISRFDANVFNDIIPVIGRMASTYSELTNNLKHNGEEKEK